MQLVCSHMIMQLVCSHYANYVNSYNWSITTMRIYELNNNYTIENSQSESFVFLGQVDLVEIISSESSSTFRAFSES